MFPLNRKRNNPYSIDRHSQTIVTPWGNISEDSMNHQKGRMLELSIHLFLQPIIIITSCVINVWQRPLLLYLLFTSSFIITQGNFGSLHELYYVPSPIIQVVLSPSHSALDWGLRDTLVCGYREALSSPTHQRPPPLPLSLRHTMDCLIRLALIKTLKSNI